MPIVVVLVGMLLVTFEPWESRSPRCNACVLVQAYKISTTRPSKNSFCAEKKVFSSHLTEKVWVEEGGATKWALGSGGEERQGRSIMYASNSGSL